MIYLNRCIKLRK